MTATRAGEAHERETGEADNDARTDAYGIILTIASNSSGS